MMLTCAKCDGDGFLDAYRGPFEITYECPVCGGHGALDSWDMGLEIWSNDNGFYVGTHDQTQVSAAVPTWAEAEELLYAMRDLGVDEVNDNDYVPMPLMEVWPNDV